MSYERSALVTPRGISLPAPNPELPLVTPEMFDTPGGFSGDAGPGLNRFFAYLNANSGQGMMTGHYRIVTPVTVNLTFPFPWAVYAYGSRIRTSGGIYGLTFSGGNTAVEAAIYGLFIDHNSSAASAALGGLLFQNVTCNLLLVHPYISAGGTFVSGTYKGMTFLSAGGQGNYWVELLKPTIRVNDSGPNIPVGIYVENNSNSLRITGGQISACVDCIYLAVVNGDPNAIVIDGVAFEGFTNAIHAKNISGTQYLTGARIINNRYETGTKFYYYEAGTGTTNAPTRFRPVFSGNVPAGVVTYMDIPANMIVNSFDLIQETSDPGIKGVLYTDGAGNIKVSI